MAPHPLHTLASRQALSIRPPNPLNDKNFLPIVIGLAVGSVVFLIIVILLLCLYRENSPLKQCCGSRFKRATETPPPPHLKQFSASPAESQADLVAGAQGMGQIGGREDPFAFVKKADQRARRFYQRTARFHQLQHNGGGRAPRNLGVGVGLRQKRTRTRTSLDLSILPISKLIPSFPLLPSSPTQLLSLPSLPIPPPFVFSALPGRPSTPVPRAAEGDNEYVPNARHLVISGGSFREYSWLLDIIHDHTAGLFRHNRLSQLGPYRLARVLEIGLAEGEADSGYCGSPASRGTGTGVGR